MQILRGWKDGVPGRSVNASQLERWLGAEDLKQISESMRHWYGPPIALFGVPGAVFVHKGGDFRGELRGGYEATALDYARDFYRTLNRNVSRAAKENRNRLNAGFPDLATLVSRGKNGHKQTVFYDKAFVAPTFSPIMTDPWRLAGIPLAGAAPAAAPGGTANSKSTTGAMMFQNARTGEQQYLAEVKAYDTNGENSRCVLLYDRIFSVAKTMASAAAEAVTGVPTRYQSTTPGAADYAGGNFVANYVGASALTGSTAHTWTITYTAQDNTAARTTSIAQGVANVSAGLGDFGETIQQWFYRLQDPDSGVKNITQLQCSTAATGGSMDFIMGHPLAIFSTTLSTRFSAFNFINSAFNLVRVFDDACLAVTEFARANNTAARLTLDISLVGA
jgi:hypothetical protein